MDRVFASSRGHKMIPLVEEWHPTPSKLIFQATSSAKLQQLQNDVYTFLESTNDPTNCHAYFVAGLCDITVKERRGSYEETYYFENPTITIQRMNYLIDSISQHVTFFGAKPCFATIIPCSLRDWNQTRLAQHKTTHLKHSQHYQDMQQNLNRAIIEINQHIAATNASNNMQTPHLASTLMTQRHNQSPRIHLNRLADGVHPTDDLAKTWAKCLLKVILNNRYAATPDPSDWDDLLSASDRE